MKGEIRMSVNKIGLKLCWHKYSKKRNGTEKSVPFFVR